MSLEDARQNAIGMMKLEEWAKANVPKGKKYMGLTFKPFKEKINGFWSMGYRAEPVFEDKEPHHEEKS